jgi:hypothetical protein
MRATYVMRGGRLVRKEHAAPLNEVHRRGAYVVSDEMPATKHMGTGAMLTSKRAFAAHTRAVGAVEVGNDPAVARPSRPPPAPPMHEYVQRAIAQLESR